jgi:hypothetical protein
VRPRQHPQRPIRGCRIIEVHPQGQHALQRRTLMPHHQPVRSRRLVKQRRPEGNWTKIEWHRHSCLCVFKRANYNHHQLWMPPKCRHLQIPQRMTHTSPPSPHATSGKRVAQAPQITRLNHIHKNRKSSLFNLPNVSHTPSASSVRALRLDVECGGPPPPFVHCRPQAQAVIRTARSCGIPLVGKRAKHFYRSRYHRVLISPGGTAEISPAWNRSPRKAGGGGMLGTIRK